MSRLNKLIDEELEKTKPSNAVILMGMDGNEIPEDNIQIEIIDMKQKEMDHVQNTVDSNNVLVETITDLAGLLKKMRVEEGNKENIKVVLDAVNNLTGLAKEHEIAMESFSNPDRYIARGISQEGFIDVVKAIFMRIRDIIVGFFKALWSFIKSIFVYEAKAEKTTKDNKTRLKQIIDGDLKLDLEDAKPITTSLPYIVDTSDVQASDPRAALTDTVLISKNYVKVLNVTIDKALSEIDTITNSMKELINDLKKEEFDTRDVQTLTLNYDKIIKDLLSLRKVVLPNELEEGRIPESASDTIKNKIGTYNGKLVFSSLVDVNDRDERLASSFNVFGAYSSEVINEKSVVDLTVEDVAFAFGNFFQSAKSSEIGKVSLDPITDPKLLQFVYESLVNDNKNLKFGDVVKRAEKVGNNITSLTEYMAQVGYGNLVAIDNYVESGCRSDDEQLEIIINEIIMAGNDKYRKVIIELFSYGMGKYGDRDDHPAKYISNASTSTGPKSYKTLSEMEALGNFRFEEKEKKELLTLFKDNGLAAIVEDKPGPVPLEKVKVYQDTVLKVNDIFKYGIDKLAILIKQLVADTQSTYTVMYDSAQKYLEETMKQYR